MVEGNWLTVSHFERKNFTGPFIQELTTKGRVMVDLERNMDKSRDFKEAKERWNVLGDEKKVLET